MKRKKSVWLVSALVALLVISGCGTTASSGNPTPATPASSEAKTLNIGYTGPMSGGAAYYGKDCTDGLDLAVEEINTKGLTVAGQNYKINLIKLDDQYLPDKSATNAHRLKSESKTPIIFTPHSGGTFALQQFNETEGFLLMAYTSEPKATSQGNKLTVRIPPPYDLYPTEWSKQAMAKFGKKVAMVPTTSQYGKDWSTLFQKVWKDQGGTVVGDFAVDYNKEADFSTYVSKALAANPDVLFVGGPSQPTALVIKQARQLGFKGGFVIMDQAKVEQMVPTISMEDLNGAIGVVPVGLAPFPGAVPFVDRFKAKYNRVPAWESAWNYEAMILVAKGIEKAGNVDDPTKILAGMRAVMPLDVPSLAVPLPGLDAGGGMMTDGNSVMVENGKYDKPFAAKNPATK